MTLAERFWAKVQKTDGCWLWTGSRDEKGYGRIGIDGVNRRAHQVAYELTYGARPAGAMICHHCDVTNCVRPDHLYAGSGVTNARDREVRGRRIPANTRKTHCPQGHPYNERNTYRDPNNGRRRCRVCHAAQMRDRRRVA